MRFGGLFQRNRPAPWSGVRRRPTCGLTVEPLEPRVVLANPVDLAVESVSVNILPQARDTCPTLPPPPDVTVSFTVLNHGSVTADKPYFITLYWSRDQLLDSSDNPVKAPFSGPTVAAGQRIKVGNIQLTHPGLPGQKWYLIVFVDSGDLNGSPPTYEAYPDEPNENDNKSQAGRAGSVPVYPKYPCPVALPNIRFPKLHSWLYSRYRFLYWSRQNGMGEGGDQDWLTQRYAPYTYLTLGGTHTVADPNALPTVTTQMGRLPFTRFR